ncbi:(2Fe-2S)-binding protein [Clostridium sp. LIBA-8841]|uniref:(2Fe-2S)-binding protein n=1 Tax=Clostridium sp. LIBA-8841 TaxID=2987530 RepID=UPI002AC450E9|nr:(2Fe-2S)-binding protein [Clostridium sp. LIBA-8841]MDZ5255281.1 (2Fe-2S)-binding protein [Clostridium sp. LIBA-8841]
MSNIDNDKIVCRCKKVSERTIIEAIKNGADTYEKVKKETGANVYGCFACRLEIKRLIEENK